MKFADRLKFTATGTSAATITVGAAVGGCRTLAQAIADGALTVGDTNVPFTITDGTAWEDSLFTVTSTTLLTRTQVLASSAGGTTAAAFSGALTVFNAVPGAILSRVNFDSDVAFSQTIPLSQPGTAWMAQTNVAGALKFTPGAAAVKGARCYLRMVADGVNAPDFTSWAEWGGSLGYNNTAGLLNEIQFMYDGYDYWYSASQGVNAVASASALTLSRNAASTTVGSPVTVTVGANAALTGSQSETVTLSAPVAGSWSVNPVTLNASTQSTTSVFTPSAAGSGNITATASGTPSLASASVSYAAIAPDTTVPVMIGTLSSSNVTQSGFALSWQAASDNVAVTGYEYSTDGGTTYSDAGNVLTVNVSGRAASTQYPCAVRAYDAAGNRATPITANVTTSAPVADTTAPSMSGTLTTSNITATGFTMSWPAGSDNVAVTGYETSINGGTTYTDVGNVLTVNKTGLSSGATYPLAVRAYDAAGNRSAALTASVTTSAGAATLNMVARENTTASSGTYTGTLSAQSYGTGSPSGGIMDQAFLNGADGTWIFRVSALTAGTNELHAALGPCDFVPDLNSVVYGLAIRAAGYTPYQNGASKTAANSVTAAVGDYVKFTRVGSALTAYVSKDSQSTWTTIYAWTAVTTQLFAQIRFTNAAAVDSLSGTGLGAAVKTPIRLTGAGITEGGSAGAYTYTGNGTVAAFSASQAGMPDKVLSTSTNGSITVPITTLGTGKVLVGCQSAATLGAVGNTFVAIADDSPYAAYVSGSSNGQTNTITPASGDLMRWTRQVDGTIRVQVSKDSGVSYTSVKEFTQANATYNYLPVYLTGTTAIGPVVATGVS